MNAAPIFTDSLNESQNNNIAELTENDFQNFEGHQLEIERDSQFDSLSDLTSEEDTEEFFNDFNRYEENYAVDTIQSQGYSLEIVVSESGGLISSIAYIFCYCLYYPYMREEGSSYHNDDTHL